MAKEQRRRLLGGIIDVLIAEIQEAFLHFFKRLLRQALKFVILSVVGTSFVVAGLIFILNSVIGYLGTLMPPWLAMGIGGVITLLIGMIALMPLFLSKR